MQKSLSCAIIGAGSIGGLIDSPQSPNIASHAHAIQKHPRCRLLAICEPNTLNQNAFIARWGETGLYHSTASLLEYEAIDLLFIASPTPYHMQALELGLKTPSIEAIVCEKPIVSTQRELETITPLLRESDKKVLIHLMRRYDPSFITLANQLASKQWGEVLGFQGVFTKGLLHNGVHMLSLLRHFFGAIKTIKPISLKRLSDDVSGNFDVHLEMAHGQLSCYDALGYSAFELSIWCEHGKIEIKEGGSKIDTYVKKPSPLYEGYFSLEHEATLPNTLNTYALNSLEFLLQNDDITCKQILQEHLEVHATIFDIIENAR